MHVYFVRHGETELNRRYRHQSPGTPLSPRGEQQARRTAEYLTTFEPSLLLTSDYTRALETARIIGSRHQLSPQPTDLFREIVRPTSLCGKSLFHPRTYAYVVTSFFKRYDPTWHFDDAENFTEVVGRAQAALIYLEALTTTHQSVVVVSHTVFINVLVSYMCKRRMLDIRDMLPAVLNIRETDNGEVVGVRYLGKPVATNTCPWELILPAW